MKLPPLGWAFFGLTMIVLIGYVLNRGLYVGSTTNPKRLENGMAYEKTCRYLYLNGVHEVWVAIELTRGAADRAFCPPIKNSN